jgi:hypothetical protein
MHRPPADFVRVFDYVFDYVFVPDHVDKFF